MSSAWGQAFGAAWGDSWGAVDAVIVEQPHFQPGGRLVEDDEEYLRRRAAWREIEALKAKQLAIAVDGAAVPALEPEVVAKTATNVAAKATAARPIAVATEIHNDEQLAAARGLAMLLALNELDD
jgi:hypothetical protein